MTLNVVKVKDNIDCYKFDMDIFREEVEKMVVNQTSNDFTIKDLVSLVIKSYGIIGDGITSTLLNVMAMDVKNTNISEYLRDGIEAVLCCIMFKVIQKKRPDAELSNITDKMNEKWNAFVTFLENV